jgi:hypothetical protein
VSFPWSWVFLSVLFLLPQSLTDVSLSYLGIICQKFHFWFVKYLLRKQREFVRFREMRFKITFKVQEYHSHLSLISQGRVSSALVWPARSRKKYGISKHTWSETWLTSVQNSEFRAAESAKCTLPVILSVLLTIEAQRAHAGIRRWTWNQSPRHQIKKATFSLLDSNPGVSPDAKSHILDVNMFHWMSIIYSTFLRPSKCPKWSPLRPLLRCRRRMWHVNLWLYFTSHFLFIH